MDPACEPGCSCGTPSAGKGVRIVISLIALLLVAGIVLYKVSAAKTAVAVNPVTANDPSPATPPSRAPLASPGRTGESLESLKKEAKLLQAFPALSGGGGCCPSEK